MNIRRYLSITSVAVGMLLSHTAFAGLIGPRAFPEPPTITSPQDGDTDVSTSPRLESTAMESTGYTALDTSWVLYESVDNTALVQSAFGISPEGSIRISENDYLLSYADLAEYQSSTKTITLPEETNITVAGERAHTVRIDSRGNVRVYNQAQEALMDVDLAIAAPDEYGPLPVFSSMVQLQADSVLIPFTWMSAPGLNSLTFFIEINSTDSVSIFSYYSDLNEAVFNATGSSLSISISDSIFNGPGTLAQWKQALSDISETDFGMQFIMDDEGVIQWQPAERSFNTFEVYPDFIQYYDNEFYDSRGSNTTLKPGTDYTAHAIFITTDNTSPSRTIYSEASDPVHFSTALNSQYTLNLAAPDTIVAGTPVVFNFTLANEGTDPGIPLAEVRLPFSAEELTEGDISELFSAVIDSETDAEAQCSVTIVEGDTVLGCTLPMEADTSAVFSATATFAQSGNYGVEYRVCETLLDRCEGVDYFTASVTVGSVTEEPAPADPGDVNQSPDDDTSYPENGSSGSSNGGALFWLTLLALPFARRLRSSHHFG